MIETSVTDIGLEVKMIRESSKIDEEKAHSLEDRLYILTLSAIRDGATNPAELARAALEARRIRFPRWCA